MKSSRTTKTAGRTSTSRASIAAAKRNGIDTGLSPSKRHRERLNTVMDELCELLPLSEEVKTSLDRLSVLKLTVSFFHTQNLMITDSSRKSYKKQDGSKELVQANGLNISELALQAIGGFFLVLTDDGIVNYISENVKSYTGYHQTRLMHQEFFPIVHPDDLLGLKSCFHSPKHAKSNGHFAEGRQECFCNIKCHAGRLSSHISPFYYKCFKIYGHVKTVTNRCTGVSKLGFFALCSPVNRQIDICRPLNSNVKKYTCKMDAGFGNLEVDSRGLKNLGLTEKDISGRTSYCFFHPDDLHGMALAHECLLQGRRVCITFRVLIGGGKWQWVRGRAYSIMKNGKVDGMVSKNFFLSDEEGEYFKEQDIKDIKEWRAQNVPPLPSTASSPSSSSCRASPGIDELTFHSVQLAPFPAHELPQQMNGYTKDYSLPPVPAPIKKGKPPFDDNSLPCNDLTDIDNESILKVINDLQKSLLDCPGSKLPGQFHTKLEGEDASDIDMFAETAIAKMEEHLLHSGQPFFYTRNQVPLPEANQIFRDAGNVLGNREELMQNIPPPNDSYLSIPDNGGSDRVGTSELGYIPMVEQPTLLQNAHIPIISKETVPLDENSLIDFVPLPLVDVENILSIDECSMNSNPLASNQRVDTKEHLFQYPNSFHHGIQQEYCFGSTGYEADRQSLQSENKMIAENNGTKYTTALEPLLYDIQRGR